MHSIVTRLRTALLRGDEGERVAARMQLHACVIGNDGIVQGSRGVD
jgi:hypothetical protein